MSRADLVSVGAVVQGRVQGVFFRAFVSRRAAELGLTGYVRNVSGGESVEVYAEGERGNLEQLVAHLKVGPPSARVAVVVADWSDYTGGYLRFDIRY